MTAHHLLIEGLRGLFAGERFLLCPGHRAVIGRSRGCAISVKATRGYHEDPRAPEARDRSLRRMSRRHLSLEFHPSGDLSVRNLSPNGMEVGDLKADDLEVAFAELAEAPITLRFGDGEALQLTLIRTIGEPLPAR